MKRLASLDALRGFDMWFISGGAWLVTALAVLVCGKGHWLAVQMSHVAWEGLRHHDTIFPLFLFLAGVSWPFSYASQLAKGATLGQIHWKILKRVMWLFGFGLSFGGILAFSPTFRLMSVLGFIGLSWGIAALIFLHVKSTKARIVITVVLMALYFAALHFFAAPGAPADAWTYAKEYNVVTWLDRLVYPEHLMIPLSMEATRGFAYEPESLFSVPSGVTMALLGMFAGSILKLENIAAAKKVLYLFLIGLGLLALTLLLVFVVKAAIVKALWSTSFVTAAATYSFMMLAFFYWIIDVCGWVRWTLYFRVIGMNSITIYLAQAYVGLETPRDKFFGGLAKIVPPEWSPVVLALGYLAVAWVFLYFLYRKNIFLKV